jgi:hypothetical protein
VVHQSAATNYGKAVLLPAVEPCDTAMLSIPDMPSVRLEDARDILCKWQIYYWAKRKVTALSSEENALMRQKVSAFNIFAGNKPWAVSRPYTADYLDVDDNKNRLGYQTAVQALFADGGDAEILFADQLIKVNRKFAQQWQCIVITDKHAYKYAANAFNQFKMIKAGTPLTALKSISLSPFSDGYAILHMEAPYRDMVLDCATNEAGETFSELVTVLSTLVEEREGRELPVSFGDNASFDNGRVMGKTDAKEVELGDMGERSEAMGGRSKSQLMKVADKLQPMLRRAKSNISTHVEETADVECTWEKMPAEGRKGKPNGLSSCLFEGNGKKATIFFK